MVPPPTITAAQMPDGYGRLQSDDAQRHGRSIVDAIAVALA
jgi:hypothetical protein